MELRWKQPSEPRVQNHKDMKTAAVLPLTRLHGDNKSEKKHLSSVNLRIIQVSASPPFRLAGPPSSASVLAQPE